jgi:hypothetical protein
MAFCCETDHRGQRLENYVVASRSASARRPASVILTHVTSTGLPPGETRARSSSSQASRR